MLLLCSRLYCTSAPHPVTKRCQFLVGPPTSPKGKKGSRGIQTGQNTRDIPLDSNARRCSIFTGSINQTRLLSIQYFAERCAAASILPPPAAPVSCACNLQPATRQVPPASAANHIAWGSAGGKMQCWRQAISAGSRRSLAAERFVGQWLVAEHWLIFLHVHLNNTHHA